MGKSVSGLTPIAATIQWRFRSSHAFRGLLGRSIETLGEGPKGTEGLRLVWGRRHEDTGAEGQGQISGGWNWAEMKRAGSWRIYRRSSEVEGHVHDACVFPRWRISRNAFEKFTCNVMDDL